MADDSNHTLDELFQILAHARGMSPVEALREIEDKLALDKLHLSYRIRGGAVSYYGKIAPPEGLTGPVLLRAWQARTMYLAIEEGRLTVIPKGPIDGFDRADTSFVVEDWFLVNEFWPPKAKGQEKPPEPAKNKTLMMPTPSHVNLKFAA
jgi:hypothetical protein